MIGGRFSRSRAVGMHAAPRIAVLHAGWFTLFAALGLCAIGVHCIDLARPGSGAWFASAAGRQTIFVLVGSMDQRDFYLCALAAIAQIAGHDGFLRQWLRWKGIRQLRGAVLAAKRTRLD